MKKPLLLSTILCTLSSLTQADVIDFDNLTKGTIVDDEYAPLLTVGVENLGGGPDVAVIFDTRDPSGHDYDLGGPFYRKNSAYPEKYEPKNVLIIHERFDCDDYTCREPDDEGSRQAGRFFFNFTPTITLKSIDFFDIETAENGERSENAIRLFDAADEEIMANTFYTPDTGGDNMWDRLVFNVEGVKRIELNMGGSGAIDNIEYSVIPIPSAIWLFGCGLIGLVALARRRTS